MDIEKPVWEVLLEGTFDDDNSKADKYYGAGRYVKTVFDDYCLVVLSRMIVFEDSNDGWFSFQSLADEYEGCPDYYERESVLLAKRVYRYLKEKELNDDKLPLPVGNENNDFWLTILFHKSFEQERRLWKVRSELRDVINDNSLCETRKWSDHQKKRQKKDIVKSVIKFLINNEKNEYSITDIKNGINYIKNDKSFNNPISYCRASSPTVESGTQERADPNYFYNKDGRYGLTGWLDTKEDEADVCKKPLPNNQKTELRDSLRNVEYAPTNKEIVDNLSPLLTKKTPEDKRAIQETAWNNISEAAIYFTYRSSKAQNYRGFAFGYPTYFYKKEDINIFGKPIRIKMALLSWGEEADSAFIECKKNGIEVDGIRIEGVKIWDQDRKDEYELREDGPFHYGVEVPSMIIQKYARVVDNKYVYTDIIEFMLKAILGDKKMTTEKMTNLLKARKQLILNGAPGTGKTYTAKEIAAHIVAEDQFSNEAKTVHVVPESENAHAEAKANQSDITPGKQPTPIDNSTDGNNPATTENNTFQTQPVQPSYETLLPEQRARIEIVQFHPGYDYSDFIIGLKPVLIQDDQDGKTIYTKPIPQPEYEKNDPGKLVERKLEGKVTLAYAWQNGVFKEFAEKAAKNKEENGDNADKFVFIIDEINRADLSNVFGEAFSRLEADYRGKEVILPSGHKFSIPENLYIIGTMNDIDRSVESMDFALRRRFAWHEITAEDSAHIIKDKVQNKAPEEKREKFKPLIDALQTAMTEINNIVAGKYKGDDNDLKNLGLGTEYQLGGAYFVPDAKKYKDFNPDDEEQRNNIRDDLWNHHIKVILNDYLRGNKNKEIILGKFEGIYNGAFVEWNEGQKKRDAQPSKGTGSSDQGADAGEAAEE